MNPINQHYIIDLSSNNNFVQVPVMQGDGNDTRTVEIELIENGTQYIVDKSTNFITIAGTKPDGTEIWNVCDVSAEGYILVDITYQMSTVVGRSIYTIAIFDSASNRLLQSFPFYILVTQTTYDPGYIMSTNEFEALAQSITIAERAAEAAKEYAEDAAMYGTIAVMHIQSTNGHLYSETVDGWRGSFAIKNGTNLEVTWE